MSVKWHRNIDCFICFPSQGGCPLLFNSLWLRPPRVDTFQTPKPTLCCFGAKQSSLLEVCTKAECTRELPGIPEQGSEHGWTVCKGTRDPWAGIRTCLNRDPWFLCKPLRRVLWWLLALRRRPEILSVEPRVSVAFRERLLACFFLLLHLAEWQKKSWRMSSKELMTLCP